MSSSMVRRLATAALVTYAVAISIVLLEPSQALPTGAVTRVAQLGNDLGLPGALVLESRVEFGLNVVALAPLAILGAVVWPGLNLRDWTALGFGASALVELAQGVLLEDRHASFSDIVANTLGAAAGYLCVAALRGLWPAGHRGEPGDEGLPDQKLARISPTGSPPPSSVT